MRFLPILHLNGFKIIDGRAILSTRNSNTSWCGWTPFFVEGEEPEEMHRQMAAAVENAISQIHAIQKSARENKDPARPRWPMIVLNIAKGWTGPRLSTA